MEIKHGWIRPVVFSDRARAIAAMEATTDEYRRTTGPRFNR
ncbi:hypothetical protein EDD55_1142 [Varunaivibrio sulfuroxidans]|uniref:Uncharacterized protein n=1 Tax=Varunaivibrio sulfuroxidans TaxID=1773489 RepID=A0A4V2UMY7_9PROT|nr:hypothetical protein EDD55_1142 [Varunaivibrio sulfuroxidans]